MAEQIEEWRPIANYPDYEVSNIGNVRSNKNGKVKLLKPQNDRYGYKRVCLSSNRNRKIIKVHRLVAFAFIEQVGGKLTVDHIDRDRSNNNIENLRWADRYDQSINTRRYRADILETDPKLRQAIIKKEYQEANRAKASEKIICECGASVSRRNISAHRKTDRHLKLMRGEPTKVDRSKKMTCECGASVRHSDIARHRTSDKHAKLMEEQNNN